MGGEMKGHDMEGSALATMGKFCVATWQMLLWEAHFKMIAQIMISAKAHGRRKNKIDFQISKVFHLVFPTKNGK
jgi:hypothetical protein